MSSKRPKNVLLTGATGYVGGRLLRVLEEDGYHVRCLARTPENLAARVGPNTEVVAGDVLDADSIARAMEGIDYAYYLVHSMGTGGDFEEEDRQAARIFGSAAKAAGVQRIVYLGGLGEENEDLSPHLRSRHEVGRVLSEAGVPVIEFRASIILGSGSLSFEMIRALVDRLPVMITPRWVRVLAQPILISDVVAYLRAALDLDIDGGRVFEIGGPDRVSYRDLMQEYARQRGLRRLMIPVPFLTPRISSLWLGLVTPLYARVGRKLISSIRNPTVVNDDAALREFGIRPVGVRESMARALRAESDYLAGTRWNDAVSASLQKPTFGGVRFGSRLVDSRSASVDVPVEHAFLPILRIGGKRGWYCADWLWQIRGFLDLLIGGVGMRRGRRDPESVVVGDTVDCWRVEAIEPNRRLRLAAEMRVPGRAWLEFDVEPTADGSRIRQTAVFEPNGLLGLAYWYLVYPLHHIVFSGMLRGIVRRARWGPHGRRRGFWSRRPHKIRLEQQGRAAPSVASE